MFRGFAEHLVKFHQVLYRLSRLTRTDREQAWFAAVLDLSSCYSCVRLQPVCYLKTTCIPFGFKEQWHTGASLP